jgi:hypothetical protein
MGTIDISSSTWAFSWHDEENNRVLNGPSPPFFHSCQYICTTLCFVVFVSLMWQNIHLVAFSLMLFYAIYILSYCTWENDECNKYMQIHQSYRVGLYLWYSELFTCLSLWNVSPWLSIDVWRSDVSIESNLGCLPCGVYNFKENPSVTFVLAFKWTVVFLEYLNLLLFWQNFMSLLEPRCFNPPVD